MFLIDVSPLMGTMRQVEVPVLDEGGNQVSTKTVEMSDLKWAMQFVLLKIQEMVSQPASERSYSKTCHSCHQPDLSRP